MVFCIEDAYAYKSSHSDSEAKKRCEIAGSIRRGLTSEHDIDIVCVNPEMPRYKEKKDKIVLPHATGTCVLDVHTSHPDHYGPMMLTWTGPPGANIGMRSKAATKGMKLSQYGLFDRRTNERLDDNTEDDICMKVLGRPCKAPELR